MKFKIQNSKFKITGIIICLLVSLFVVIPRPVVAQETKSDATMTGEIKATDAAMMQQEVKDSASQLSKYQLPYPGLLPDHPLYFLKAARDRIIDLLIADPLKKAEFTLLQADKRLSMASALADEGKNDLAQSTESKGQNYLARTFDLLERAKKEGKDTKGLTSKLSASLEKHEEVLLELANKTSGSIKDSFTAMAQSVAQKRKSL